MKNLIPRTYWPLLATIVAFVLLFSAAAIRHQDSNFLSLGVVNALLSDNAVLGIAAIGMTLVILSGGIDLSVGAVAALTTIIIAKLVMQFHFHPLVAISLTLLLGVVFGGGQGFLIHRFNIPPFLVTLAGMFLARGTALMISQESIAIRHPWYQRLDQIGFDFYPVTAILFLTCIFIGIAGLRYTSFGRSIYAVGGNEQSAQLMGLPVGRIKVGTYALSGLCAAFAGVVSTFYTASGNATSSEMLELDAIAAAVIGGTLLTGGVGGIFGTLIGVLIFGTVQTAIMFEHGLNSSWTRILIGALLLFFIVGQKFLQSRTASSARS